jgi:hypothetical protein
MKRIAISCLVVIIAATACGSQSPSKKPQTMTLEQWLEQTEKKMAKVAADHDKTMARMKQIEDQMDKLIQSIKAFREKLKGG